MTRVLLPAALAVTLLAGCGSTRSQTLVQRVPPTVVQVVPETPSPLLACIVKRSPTGATHEKSGVLTVEWPDGEMLMVTTTSSRAEAEGVVAKVHAEQVAHFTGVTVEDHGTAVVEWRPKAPTAEETAVLRGC
jgi:hypothetical protein